MIIVRKRIDNVVVVVLKDSDFVQLTPEGLELIDVTYGSLDVSNSELLYGINNVPDDFAPNAYSYDDGDWTVEDPDAIAANLPIALAKAKLVKRELVNVISTEKSVADFAYDFGTIEAQHGAETAEAGIRHLQIRGLEDKTNWNAVCTAATLATFSGQGASPMPIRCEDNWNVQTTAAQVLDCVMALFQRQASLLFYGGYLKDSIDNAPDFATLNAIDINSGWPA